VRRAVAPQPAAALAITTSRGNGSGDFNMRHLSVGCDVISERPPVPRRRVTLRPRLE
jgi:hypothetical protein